MISLTQHTHSTFHTWLPALLQKLNSTRKFSVQLLLQLVQLLLRLLLLNITLCVRLLMWTDRIFIRGLKPGFQSLCLTKQVRQEATVCFKFYEFQNKKFKSVEIEDFSTLLRFSSPAHCFWPLLCPRWPIFYVKQVKPRDISVMACTVACLSYSTLFLSPLG